MTTTTDHEPKRVTRVCRLCGRYGLLPPRAPPVCPSCSEMLREELRLRMEART